MTDQSQNLESDPSTTWMSRVFTKQKAFEALGGMITGSLFATEAYAIVANILTLQQAAEILNFQNQLNIFR